MRPRTVTAPGARTRALARTADNRVAIPMRVVAVAPSLLIRHSPGMRAATVAEKTPSGCEVTVACVAPVGSRTSTRRPADEGATLPVI